MIGDINNENTKGIVPRSFKMICDYMNSEINCNLLVKCSIFEIYKESLNDLLTPNQTDLKIKEDPYFGTFVFGLTEKVEKYNFKNNINNNKNTIKLKNIKNNAKNYKKIF